VEWTKERKKRIGRDFRLETREKSDIGEEFNKTWNNIDMGAIKTLQSHYVGHVTVALSFYGKTPKTVSGVKLMWR
jgi:hypothetical protein